MPTCARCRKETGLIGSFLGFNKQTGRCGACENQIKQSMNRFRQAFLNFCADGMLSPQEWQQLRNITMQDNIDWNEALQYVRGDALHFLERTLTFAAADGMITDEEERYFHELRKYLLIPSEIARPLTERLNYLKYISGIRQGNLPVIQPSIHLESDERCHLETAAVYHKINARSSRLIPGRFIATNKKIHFLSETGGWTILWKSVMRVDRGQQTIYLELSTKTGNGHYGLNDPVLAEAVIDALARMSKRQLIAPQKDAESRHIPQDVKIAVWQRDQGKCTQCGESSYLEFDHIIPFSKGGASTLGNVQLLCRRCNLGKGDRI
ncbi:MAG TPA: HNH endonuclease [Blastocatellia bacterium]|nr:HNH endonuclease [Blastocatellia bacterium]